MLPRLHVANLPTPLERHEALGARFGLSLWVKRDDMTAGAESGNKIRKLEFLLADARERGADVVITCGGLQSNHARATTLLAASLGMKALLFLRTTAPVLELGPARRTGNVLLNRLAGAEIRLVSPETYRDRARVMADAARELAAAGRRPYVIPEGGSNGLGSLGYVEAMAEVRSQLDAGAADGKSFDAIVHACGSGGTAAGVALGAAKHGVAKRVIAMAVCDDAPTFEQVIARIVDEARALDPSLGPPAPLTVDDASKGPAYAVSSAEQRRTIIDVTRASGLVLDPVYTGKAFHGLARLAAGELAGGRVLFLHTGGLPGLLADGEAFADELP